MIFLRHAMDEGIEDIGHQFIGNADAEVAHCPDRFRGIAGHRDLDPSAHRRKLQRIAEHVADDLIQPGTVGIDPDRLRLDCDVALADPAVLPYLAGKTVKKIVIARGRLVSVVVG